tara:strand:+ start:437 stop:1537 length:1101 start_codon:yes stop_codon:yes gene_type:complete
VDQDLFKLINPSIEGLTPYEPGKPIEDLEREFGINKAVKLASNENPLGPSPKVIESINKEVFNIHRYPDGNGFRLKEAIASKFKIKSSSLTLGNGSNDIIEFVARCFLNTQSSVVFSQYAFAVYPLVIKSLGAKPIEVKAKDWGHDLQAMLEAIEKDTKIIFIANPNNPTGTFIKKREIIRFLEKVPNNKIVFLDQAYFEYSDYEEEDVTLDIVNNFENLVISRTFSKAYGLAGLRVGYSVSSEPIANYLNRIRQPFNVNSLALKAAEIALSDDEHLERCLSSNKKEKIKLYNFFQDNNFDYIDSLANFICFNCKEKSREVFERLLPKGVISRSMEVYKMPDHLRLTIGTPEENDIFMNKLIQSYE